ncbi:unnamed protein product [Peronospora destructor]|uniref:Myb-like domain-containing protein n=1 Tax=Peronospora destructor TaxID=86335 RepID=A0AAV0U6I2_9STRA|nr:unnamed protein product [Peronospora destructor]
MRAALEVCGEFLSHIGALEEANAIAEILHKIGVELSATSPFRWRALLAAIDQELDAEPMDVVFLFERILQLDTMMPLDTSRALFESPLFLHLSAERFAVAFEGLDAELFKLESDEMCHAEGIYETNENSSELTTFLETFKKIFELDEPKDCWDAFYDFYRLNGSAFRRDMKRALCMIESVTLGPTKLELAFPTQAAEGPEMIVPRASLEKRFGGTRREWRGRSRVIAIAGGDADHKYRAFRLSHLVWSMRVLFLLKREPIESVHSNISKEDPTSERPVSSRPPRAAEVARRTRQEGRRAATRTRVPSEDGEPRSIGRPSGRRKRVRWSAEEEAALIEGYRLYESYSNVWVLIKTKYPDVLRNRSNVDLKDKYRNLVRYGRIIDGNDNVGVTDNDATDDNACAADINETSDA